MNISFLIPRNNVIAKARDPWRWILASFIAASMLTLVPSGARAQVKPAPSTYVVKADDTLLTMAERLRGPKATMNQMALALARANMGPFKGRPGVPAPAGTVLTGTAGRLPWR